MEKEGIILREKGKEDARQIIVTLTPKGKQLQEELGNVPLVIGNAVMCNSITPETVPELFKMLDDMIDRLSGNRCDSSGQPK